MPVDDNMLDTAEELGHEMFHLTAALIHVKNRPDSTAEELEQARVRLVRLQDEISEALWDNSDFALYDTGLRSAIATHLHDCSSARDRQSMMIAPLQPEEAHAIRLAARHVLAGLGPLGHLDEELRSAVASLYDSHARLGEALRRSVEPMLLIV